MTIVHIWMCKWGMHNCLPFFYKPTYLTTSSFSNSYSLLYFISASTAQEMQKLCGGELLGAALLSSITGWQPLEGEKPYAPHTTLHEGKLLQM
jgi:hypothetical protein